MNTGYISSDFMEIRQHLAHYGVKGMVWGRHKKTGIPGNTYEEDKQTIQTIKEKLPTSEHKKAYANNLFGYGNANNKRAKFNPMSGTYEYRTQYESKGSKAGMPTNKEKEATNIRKASQKDWSRLSNEGKNLKLKDNPNPNSIRVEGTKGNGYSTTDSGLEKRARSKISDYTGTTYHVSSGKDSIPTNAKSSAQRVGTIAEEQKAKLRKKKAQSQYKYASDRYRIGR